MSRTRRDVLKHLATMAAAMAVPAATPAAPGLAAASSPSRPEGPARAQAGFRGRAPGESRELDGIPFRWCPPGRFVMGSPSSERGHRADEAQVDVVLTRGFWTAQHEVTQRQWRDIVGAFPDRLPSARFGEGDDVPLYSVNFHEAEAFCAALTRRLHASGALASGWAVDLPTEAQWEYACRAGTTTATAFGDTVERRQLNFNGTWDGENREGASERVGSYPANPWGIHDMHGNVWEWCRDYYHPRLPGGTDPDLHDQRGVINPDGSSSRVRRGGAWIEPGWACRSACRLRYEPHRRSDHIGFRVVLVERKVRSQKSEVRSFEFRCQRAAPSGGTVSRVTA